MAIEGGCPLPLTVNTGIAGVQGNKGKTRMEMVKEILDATNAKIDEKKLK